MTAATRNDMTDERARAVLGVGAGASDDDVERAFRRAVRVAHPDHGGDAGRTDLLLAARRHLLAAPTTRHASAGPDRRGRPDPPVVVVPSATWRDLLRAVLHRLRSRSHRPRPRVR